MTNTRKQQLALLANGFRQVRAAGLVKVWVPVSDAELIAWAIGTLLTRAPNAEGLQERVPE